MTSESMPFYRALEHALHTGARIARKGWNGAGQFVQVINGATVVLIGAEVFSQPFMVLRNAQGQYVPWAPSQGDLFAQDWFIVP